MHFQKDDLQGCTASSQKLSCGGCLICRAEETDFKRVCGSSGPVNAAAVERNPPKSKPGRLPSGDSASSSQVDGSRTGKVVVVERRCVHVDGRQPTPSVAAMIELMSVLDLRQNRSSSTGTACLDVRYPLTAYDQGGSTIPPVAVPFSTAIVAGDVAAPLEVKP